VRLAGLDRPTGLVFDEIFYARDACWYVIAEQSTCGIGELASRTHPPLGKWIIASGISLFGYEPFGWRVTAALAGTLSVALLYVLARRLLSPVLPGVAATVGSAAAAALLAIDFLHLVQSRVAMLDIFIVAFTVAAVLAIVLDRDRDRAPAGASLLNRLTLGRPWRLLAGACVGAGTATKWSGAYIGLALVALTIVWEIAATPRDGAESLASRARRAFRREVIPTVTLLGIVPLAAYVVSYTGRMPGEILAAPWQEGSVWRGIWDHQRAMLDFHTGLEGHHPYESAPWSWPFLKRAVAYWFTAEPGAYREILALGNPLAWWPSMVATLGVAVAWLRRGASVWQPEAVIIAGALAAYAPWLVLSGTRSQVFLWYLLPSLPFVYLAVGLLAARAWDRLAGRAVMAGYALLLLAGFAFYFPVLTALPLEPDAWWLRITFRDCERTGAPTLELPDAEINSGPPPDGWCWI
jgi:dolichyl-phosphate-mannose-protein mannosyltransferase